MPKTASPHAGPLRVAISALSARSYGGDSYIRAFIPALARYAPELEIVLLAQDDRYQDLCAQTDNHHYLKVGACGNLSGARRVVWEQTQLRRIILEERIDLFYTTNNIAIFNSPVPVVIAVRNMEPLTPCSKGVPLRHAIRHFILSKVTFWSTKKAARIMTVSNFVKETLMAMGVPAEKCDVVYHGIDDIAPSNTETVEKTSLPYVFSMAKFVRYANLETLFRGFRILKDRGYQGELRFAGGSHDRGYEAEIRALISELHLDTSVKLLGYIPRTETQRELRKADAFLFPSTLEACPFSLLEGMQQGAAIVATTCPPMPEFCQDAALFVDPQNALAFGEAAFRLVSDQSLARNLREKALLRAGQFTWERTVRDTVKCWKKAVCES